MYIIGYCLHNAALINLSFSSSLCFSLQINIGLISIKKDGLRPYRGKNVALRIGPDSSATSLLSEAVKKMRDFNKDLRDGPFLLLYPDGTEVINIPGTNSPFTLGAYKAEIGKPYQRITLFICIKSDFEEGRLAVFFVDLNIHCIIFNSCKVLNRNFILLPLSTQVNIIHKLMG